MNTGRLSSWHKRTVAGVSLLMIAAPLPAITFSLAGPSIARQLGVGLSEVMVSFSIMTLTNAVSMVALGRQVARWGARRVVLGGASWSALMLLAFSFVSVPWQLYLVSFGLGLTVALSTGMAGTILVNEWFRERRASVQGLVSAFTGVTGLILGPLLPWLINGSGWPWAYRFGAGLSFVLTVVPALLLIRSRPDEVGLVPFGAPPARIDTSGVYVPGVPLPRALRTAHFWVLLAGIVLTAAVQSLMQHAAPLARLAGLDLATVGAVMAVQSLAMVAIQIGVGLATDRFGLLAAIQTCLVGQLLAGLALTVVSGPVAFAAALIVFTSGICVCAVLVPVTALQVFGPRDFSAILGPMMGAMPAGLALGAPLWGLDYDATGSYLAGLIVAAGISALAALGFGWLLRTAPALRSRVAAELGEEY